MLSPFGSRLDPFFPDLGFPPRVISACEACQTFCFDFSYFRAVFVAYRNFEAWLGFGSWCRPAWFVIVLPDSFESMRVISRYLHVIIQAEETSTIGYWREREAT